MTSINSSIECQQSDISFQYIVDTYVYEVCPDFRKKKFQKLPKFHLLLGSRGLSKNLFFLWYLYSINKEILEISSRKNKLISDREITWNHRKSWEWYTFNSHDFKWLHGLKSICSPLNFLKISFLYDGNFVEISAYVLWSLNIVGKKF